MLRALLPAVFFSSLLSAAETNSVLGLEPGDLRLNNDDIGATLWGPDAAPTLSVGKSDVWDRRNPPPPQPVLTLEQIVEAARRGDPAIVGGQAARYYTSYGDYDFPCPRPVGQLILKLKFLTRAGRLKVERQGIRALRLRAQDGDKELNLRIFVSAERNLIVIGGEARGLSAGDVAVRLYRHRDTILPGGKVNPTLGDQNSRTDFEQMAMPRAGREGEMFWVAQDFAPEPTFPRGFTAVLAAQVSDAPATIDTVTGQTGLGTRMVAEKEGRINHGLYKRYTPINESPGAAGTATLGPLNGPFRLIATVVTTQDDPSPVERARRDLAAALQAGEAALWSEHARSLDAYEARPRARAWSADGKTKIEAVSGGVPYKMRPTGYYGDIPLCSVDSTRFCFQDNALWHADFHFNEIEATSHCILRQFDALDPYFHMTNHLLPAAQANAREIYGCTGAMFPLAHYPLKTDRVVHTHVTWEQSMEMTALVTRPVWLRFLYTGDLEFLRDLAWPALREGARFYAAFLKRGQDGLCHVFPTVSPEHRGITKDLVYNRDSQSGITLIRYHLRAAARAAELLGIAREEAAAWKKIAAQMPDYPTVASPDGPIFIDVAGAQPMEYNIAVPLSAVFWGDDIGLDSPPERLELARRTLRLINVWTPHRFYLSRVRARLGVPHPDDELSVEHFLQSYTGVIRAFPATPERFEGGFENLGAQGAFTVSALRDRKGVSEMTLVSLAGNPAAVANPWPAAGSSVTDVTTGRSVAVDARANVLRFNTVKDRRYRMTEAAR